MLQSLTTSSASFQFTFSPQIYIFIYLHSTSPCQNLLSEILIRNKTSTEKRGRSNLYHRLSLSSPSSTTMLANIFYTSKAQACICANVDGLVSSAVEMTAKISCFVHYLIKCYQISLQRRAFWRVSLTSRRCCYMQKKKSIYLGIQMLLVMNEVATYLITPQIYSFICLYIHSER